jgi:flagellar biosynthetic protein FliQ
MNQDVVINVSMQAMQLAFMVALPLLLVALGVGLIVSVFQAVTQIQEQTLSFIPKILAMGATLVIAGPWMLGQVVSYTHDLYSSIPTLVGGG